ncbi:unnamed protein product [Gulo gulo]|uniref:Profilin-4 n=1 Tax=Gulo gulo TaxID=48420 RepID=A0A9X9LXZ6_GULGU|nr:unnamed protein product [Gulo gulo]
MPHDVRTLVNGFAKNPLQTRREGLYFKEKDYKCIRADDYSLYAKNENTGVVVVKTHLYLLVATYTEGMYPSVCVEATEKLGKFVSPCLSLFPMAVRSDCQSLRANTNHGG